jgi:hypothetical protein
VQIQLAMRARKVRTFGLISLLPWLCAAACAPSAVANGPTNEAPLVAEIHAQKCGSCHSLPAAKTRSRPYLEQALARHRRRVRLSDEVWRAMLDYLAAPGDVAIQVPR